MLSLLRTFSWQELRHHPWRSGAAVLAVMLGVALAFSVHLINASALDEFQGAVRAVNGQPDLELRTVQGPLPESVYGAVATHPRVALASPVLEAQVRLSPQSAATSPSPEPPPAPLSLRVLGVDTLLVGHMAPALVPSTDAALNERLALVSPGRIYLNAAARQALALPDTATSPAGRRLQIHATPPATQPTVTVAGSIAAGGEPLAVMDIGSLQELLGRHGQLSRIDLRLAPGADGRTLSRELQALPDWSAQWRLVQPGDSSTRMSNLSRAYRVNLTVLALVALFTGAFLVFSVLALSVAKRSQQFALLGVLGLSPRERLQLVLAESLLLGLLGSLAGIALGTGLAWSALHLLGGDLGGGYFAGVAPSLRWSTPAALLYGALGLLAAAVGGWWPARAAQRLPEAQTLKGLSAAQGQTQSPWLGLALMALGAALTQAPVVAGIPLAAYLSVGLLLIGGIAALPALIALGYDRLAPRLAHRLLPLLAVERARRMRGTAAVAVSGVVASLALSVALTVMVASFRDSVTQWLDVVLPADLYLRPPAHTQASQQERAPFDQQLVQQMAQLPGVAKASGTRARTLLLDPAQPNVTLVAMAIHGPDAAQSLPLVGPALPVPEGRIGIYVSEPMLALYDAQPGRDFALLADAFAGQPAGDASTRSGPPPSFFIAGVWRDYVRQFGTIAIDSRDYQRLTSDPSLSDVALWLQPDAREADVQAAARTLAAQQLGGDGSGLSFSSVAQIRANSLRIFDRSFAVTYWLQAVAIAIGLFGVAASFSAQVLARRKEFGLLVHLGLTRRQILSVVAGEGAAWTAMGALAGLGLGLAVSTVLVHVVNPQSFHWTMDMQLPALRLALLCGAVVLAGTLTAWLAGQAAAGRDAVLAVKEDW